MAENPVPTAYKELTLSLALLCSAQPSTPATSMPVPAIAKVDDLPLAFAHFVL